MTTKNFAQFGDDLVAAVADVTDVADAAAASRGNDVDALIARVTAARARVKLLRTEVLSVDVATSFTEPVDIMAMLAWQADVSMELGRLEGLLVAAGVNLTLSRGSALAQITRHAVREGDTLQSIAARYHGTWETWYVIADANGINPAMELPIGGILYIPPVDGQLRGAR